MFYFYLNINMMLLNPTFKLNFLPKSSQLDHLFTNLRFFFFYRIELYVPDFEKRFIIEMNGCTWYSSYFFPIY